jgi:hypothetical protein
LCITGLYIHRTYQLTRRCEISLCVK